MATIELQQRAKAAKKTLKRPTAKICKGCISGTSIIIEVVAPDGTRILLNCDTHRDHTGLAIWPYRATLTEGERASIQMLRHADDCALSTDPTVTARCNCGACFRPHGFNWEPMTK
jgi:hypothetical protein